MKKSKFKLVLAFVIAVALIAPFATYATETTSLVEPKTSTAEEPAVTSENPDNATVTSETPSAEETTATEETATEGTTGETLEEVSGNYHEVNTTINFNKAVNGNAFLSGDTVTIKGEVNGDLFVLAKDVVLEQTAKIYGNLYVVCDNLTHTGLVYNLYAITTNYECKYEGVTALDLKVFAEHIKFAGYSERSAYFISDDIELTKDAYLLGNLVYTSDNEPNVVEGATIYGEKLKSDLSALFPAQTTSTNTVLNYIFSLLALLGFVLLILLVISLFKPSALSKEVSFKFISCLKALGIGLLSIIALSLIIVILFVTGILAKFATVLLGLFVLALVISSAVAILTTTLALYNKFAKEKSKLFVVLFAILVSLVYFGLSIIPFAGAIIKLLVSLIGFGFIISWVFSLRKIELGNAPKAEKKVKETKTKKIDDKKSGSDKKDDNNDTIK